ncbi:MAG TPA: glycosyltransferase family 9 protein [Candidatus Krumholzibacteria bacterium]|nr:glycosyltransferase family 9 protein [Candidatus Krumholzibacteria bacterium]HPD71077.1 glycosyltransferase family 9 protein [Candidatus Krumholzibacteria bacterium]HRY39223.1 glycosyltransferase family 9 protein [Candidatus Krumholzibacteria bacterium]
MREILVIRFGALGDLCLLGWTLSRLAAAPGGATARVTLATKARFAGLAARLAGVDTVFPLAEPGGLRQLAGLAARVRAARFDLVIDAHAVLRSRLLAGLCRRRPDAVLRKDTAARLRLLRAGEVAPALERHMRDRLDATIAAAGLPAGDATPPLAALAAPGPRPLVLGLAPGAQWDPKRWPTAHWVALVRRFRRETAAAVRVFLGPREETWFDASDLAEALTDAGHVEIVRGRPLVEVANLLAACRVLVCNDSGLMHLAEAAGTPVVAFFGPTVRAFGYTPQLPDSVILETADLDCRPCSRNGKRPCHRGDLACLERIAPERAWAAIAAHGPWRGEP